MSMVHFSFFVLILISVIVLLPILVGIYVYRDAKSRGMNAAMWTLIAILVPSLIGFIIYLLVRGSYSNMRCPQCDTTVTDQYAVCPQCGAKLRPSCPNCSTPVEPGWKVCPMCTHPLSTVQSEILTPIRPKDRGIWKILIAIVLVPVILIFALGISFSAVSSGGSSTLMVLPSEDYYNDQEIPDSTKEYVRNWVAGLPDEENTAYVLCYGWEYMEGSDKRDYLYLIYIPDYGCANLIGHGYEQGLFGSTFVLDLSGGRTQDGFYSTAVNAGKKSPPEIKVTINGQKLKVKLEMVEFNPTPYVIASESDYSMLTNASGDLYIEVLEKEMQPDLVAITKVVDGEEITSVEHTEPDFLLNTVVGIHELEYLEENPSALSGYEFENYFQISVHYSDTTGERYYEDQSDYYAVSDGAAYYLMELATDHVYPITEEEYILLESLFE